MDKNPNAPAPAPAPDEAQATVPAPAPAPEPEELRAYARCQAFLVIDALVQIITDPKVRSSSRVRASRDLLDFGCPVDTAGQRRPINDDDWDDDRIKAELQRILSEDRGHSNPGYVN